MLEYLDQPLANLGGPERLAVLGLRVWARALRDGTCPSRALAGIVDLAGAGHALGPAHTFFSWMVAHAEHQLMLGCPCCGRVSEDEAFLLAAMFAAEPAAGYAAARALAKSEAAVAAASLARVLGRQLAPLPAQAVPDPYAGRNPGVPRPPSRPGDTARG